MILACLYLTFFFLELFLSFHLLFIFFPFFFFHSSFHSFFYSFLAGPLSACLFLPVLFKHSNRKNFIIQVVSSVRPGRNLGRCIRAWVVFELQRWRSSKRFCWQCWWQWWKVLSSKLTSRCCWMNSSLICYRRRKCYRNELLYGKENLFIVFLGTLPDAV